MHWKLRLHRLQHWEYWPAWIVYLPCLILYPVFALLSRSWFFFTAANPGIKNGGAFLVEKHEIDAKIPKDYLPESLTLDPSTDRKLQIHDWIIEKQVTFPIILKPTHGLRGNGIKLINSAEDLLKLPDLESMPYMVQDFIDYPLELGVFFIKNPACKTVKITSITEKQFMEVKGDGHSNLEALIKSNPRYWMQLQTIKHQGNHPLTHVLERNEVYTFERLGNHCKGAIFLDGVELHNQNLHELVDDILDDSTGIYYGRIDLKAKNISALRKKGEVVVIEINGAFSEPGHIYDPKYTLWNAWKVTVQHFYQLFALSRQQIRNGIRPVSLKQGLPQLRQHFQLKYE